MQEIGLKKEARGKRFHTILSKLQRKGFLVCTWKRNFSLCKKEVTVPKNSNFPAQQCQEFTCFNGLHGLPSYEINVKDTIFLTVAEW